MFNTGLVPCDDLPPDPDIVVTGYSQTITKAEVTLSCSQDEGSFATGAHTIVVTCSFVNAQWMTVVPPCVGKCNSDEYYKSS